MKKKSLPCWQIYAFVAAIFLAVNASLFAAFPPVLVIDGTAYPGAQVTGNSGAYKYVAGNGVLILYGATGGDTAWGATENAALTSPTVTSTWDGGMNVTLTGHAIIVPEVLVYYQTTVVPAALLGYDGAQHQAAGTGTASGKFVVAYNNGLADGYIFNFGDGLPIYRYQYTTRIMSIDTTSGWPPPNVFIFPSQITVSGQTLTVTSYTNGMDNGYWANAYYQGDNIYGQLHAYIAPNGNSGQLYGNVNGSDVSTTWDSTTHTFVASTGLGVDFGSPSNTPAVGSPHSGHPPQVELDGILVPFAFNDVNGSDVYWNQWPGQWIIIDSSNNVTTSDGSSGAYDSGSQMFLCGGNLAAISADGKTFLGTTPGIKVYNLSSQIQINLGSDQPQWFTQPDGGIAKYFPNPPTGVFSFGSGWDLNGWGWANWWEWTASSPNFFYSGGIKVIQGWGAGEVPPLPDISSGVQFYINGQQFNCGWGYGSSLGEGIWDYTQNGTDSAGGLFVYYNTDGSIHAQLWGGQYPSSVEFLDVTSGSGFSTDGSVYLSFNPTGTPQYGPVSVFWNGISLPFLTTQNAMDVYMDAASGTQVFIDSAHHVTVRNSSVSGTYTPGTYHFSVAGMIAQDANGNLLGTPSGVVMIFNGAPGDQTYHWPGGTYGQGGQSIQLADGSYHDSSNTTVYTVARNDGTWLVKYIGIPVGSLFIAKDGSGNYSSPVYRYSGDIDCVINTTSSGDWPASADLYPATLFINGHTATVDSGTQHDWGSDNTNRRGQVTYHVQPDIDETFTLYWTWGSQGGLSNAIVYGSYSSFSGFSGTWDGNLFGGLPNGLVISTKRLPISNNINSSPPQIIWNGVQLLFDPLASSFTKENPTGADIYHDSLGLGLQVTVNSDGSVTARQSNGTSHTGTYNPTTHLFQFSSSAVGNMQGANNQGIIYPIDGGAPPVLTRATTDIPGNLDIHGGVLSLGNWTDSSGDSVNAFCLAFANGQNGQPSLLNFAATRQNTDWIWSHAASDESSNQINVMRLDSQNRLLLYNLTNQTTPAIVLDPGGQSSINGPLHIAPQGDLDMGDFTQ